MDFIELIKNRRSVRKYKDTEISRETILSILDAGRHAPSAYGEEPWEYVVVTDKKRLKEVASITDYGKFIAGAAALIVVYCKEGKYYLEDGCAAVENILLAATSIGLGTCWVAGDKKKYVDTVNEYFSAPKGCKLIALIPLGIPADSHKKREKTSLNEIVHWEKF